MKSKLCWIPFIPLSLAVIAIKVFQTLSMPAFINNSLFSYIAVGIALLLFIINIIFVAIDRKTSPVYFLSRNIPAAICALLTAALIASKSALNVIIYLQNGSLEIFNVVMSLFGILAAISFVIIAFAHFQGRNFLPRMGVFFLTMPVWGCLMLISEFLNNRTISVMSIDPILLFSYAFLMVYTFKLSMVIATVDGKNPVKSLFLYGFPLSALGLALGIKTVFNVVLNGADYSENVLCFAFLALSLYTIFFNIEISRKSRTVEEQIVKFDLDDFDESQHVYGDNIDNFVVASGKQTEDYGYDYSAVSDGDTTDFVTGVDSVYNDKDYTESPVINDYDIAVAPKTDSEAIYIDKDKANAFESEVVGTVTEKKQPKPPVNLEESQMEKIDKLISDINQSQS